MPIDGQGNLRRDGIVQHNNGPTAHTGIYADSPPPLLNAENLQAMILWLNDPRNRWTDDARALSRLASPFQGVLDDIVACTGITQAKVLASGRQACYDVIPPDDDLVFTAREPGHADATIISVWLALLLARSEAEGTWQDALKPWLRGACLCLIRRLKGLYRREVVVQKRLKDIGLGSSATITQREVIAGFVPDASTLPGTLINEGRGLPLPTKATMGAPRQYKPTTSTEPLAPHRATEPVRLASRTRQRQVVPTPRSQDEEFEDGEGNTTGTDDEEEGIISPNRFAAGMRPPACELVNLAHHRLIILDKDGRPMIRVVLASLDIADFDDCNFEIDSFRTANIDMSAVLGLSDHNNEQTLGARIQLGWELHTLAGERINVAGKGHLFKNWLWRVGQDCGDSHTLQLVFV